MSKLLEAYKTQIPNLFQGSIKTVEKRRMLPKDQIKEENLKNIFEDESESVKDMKEIVYQDTVVYAENVIPMWTNGSLIGLYGKYILFNFNILVHSVS